MDEKLSISHCLRRVSYGVLGAGVVLAGLFGRWPHAELKAQSYGKPADIALSSATPAAIVGPGDTFSIQYVVSNAGPGVAHDVVLVASGEPKSTLVSTSGCSQDPVPGPFCTVSLPNGQLNPGNSATILMTFEVGARVPHGNFVVEATASATEPDPNPGNEYNSATMTVVTALPY